MRPTQVKVASSVKELFFIIAPPGHIKSDVSVLKDDVHFLIGHKFADSGSPAHLSLFKYDNDECIEDMLRYVQSKVRHFKPFNIFIKDMNVFHHGSNRTIYLEIVNKYPLRDIFEKLVKADSNFVPHITISRNLSSEDFLKTWPYLKNFQYSQHFLCDRITVLARTEGDDRWIPYLEIPFGE